jgi:hypothetical protein
MPCCLLVFAAVPLHQMQVLLQAECRSCEGHAPAPLLGTASGSPAALVLHSGSGPQTGTPQAAPTGGVCRKEVAQEQMHVGFHGCRAQPLAPLELVGGFLHVLVLAA